VRSDTNIAQLHAVLQTAMGWSDTHLHRFRIHGKAYSIARCGGIGFADDPFEVRLSDFRLRRGERFLYEYDFMDGWVVDIRLEEALAADTEGISPRCTAGRRAAPPEDCGGSWAYLSELDGHKTPPWEALEQVAAAVQRFLDTGDRAVLDDEDEFGQRSTALRPTRASNRSISTAKRSTPSSGDWQRAQEVQHEVHSPDLPESDILPRASA
jgi:hypothetical protein